MLRAMNRLKRTAITLGATTLLIGTCASLLADAKVNPYEPIVERNPFGLKPPPPPDPDAGKPPPPPPAPLATVDLTGITSILSSKRALLEIVPGPGKPMIKPILAEGERVESVEVVSINVEKNEVTIKNGNTVTNLTFKVAKAAPAAAAPPVPGLVPKPAVPVPQPQTSYNNSQSSGRYNVMVAGGSGSASPAAAPASGGVNPSAANLTGGTEGFRSIPSRNLRSNPQEQTQISPEESVLQVEVNRELNNRAMMNNPSLKLPPLPPTYANPQPDGPVNPAAPGNQNPRPGWVPRVVGPPIPK